VLGAAAFAAYMWAKPAAADEASGMWLPETRKSVRSPSRAARVVKTRAVARIGLEAGMPGDGSYARAIELDAEGHPGDALREYDAALSELDGFAELTGAGAEERSRWRRKIRWQREQSETLLEQAAYVSVMPASPLARYHLGEAYRAKFMTVKAFLGRGSRPLYDSAVAAYREALRLDPRNSGARVGLATMYAAAGRAREARLELAKLGRRKNDESLALGLAALHAALGEDDDALALLERLPADPLTVRWLAESNDFDGLRDAARFQALLAGTE
jgi:tetratricopeptide (TPR) repeat protein